MPLLLIAALLLMGAAGCGVESPDTTRKAPSWFLMSEQFTASGFMEEAGVRHVLKLTMDDCPEREADSLGNCFSFHYDPKLFKPTEEVKGGCIGVYWQSPPNNWGARPGKIVE